MKRFLLLIVFSLAITIVSGQYFGVKSNLIYDATTTINLGVEIGLGQKTTLDISGNYNPWSFPDYAKLKHWMVQPELRLWTCEKFNGHFFGIHGHVGHYDIAGINLPFNLYNGLKDRNYQGNFYGGGLSYGYQWILGNRWGLEASLGVGYVYTKYDKYLVCGATKLESDLTKHYFGPTKAAISLIYIIR